MDTRPDSSASTPATKLPVAMQWPLLLASSIAAAVLMEYASLPAALLIGPMIAAIVFATNGATVRVPKTPVNIAQGVVACLVVSSITPAIFPIILSDWPVLVSFVLSTLVASSVLGWLMATWKVLPGTTAVWGTAPGGATAMTLMASAFGADERLVAFMQYLRIIMVSLTAAVVAGLWVDMSAVVKPPTVWFPALDPVALAVTAFIVVTGAPIGRLLRLPSVNFLGTLLVGGILHLGFGLPLQLPPWLLGIAYTLVGWSVGLNFTRMILKYAFRALPKILLSTAALMAFCGALAWLMSYVLGVSPLTAYLATSPGGLDSVAIIAASSHGVDLPFVLTLQTLRIMIVILIGPHIAKVVARGVKG